jgi:hypothetical protein
LGRYLLLKKIKIIACNEQKSKVYRALDKYKQHKITTFFYFLMTILGYTWALASLLLPINLKFMGRVSYAFWRAD